MDDGFLRWQPLSVQEGATLGYWYIRNKTQTAPRSQLQLGGFSSQQTASLHEALHQCDAAKMQRCQKSLQKAHMRACDLTARWEILPGGDYLSRFHSDDPRDMVNIADCEKQKDRVSFQFGFQNPQTPIKCSMLNAADGNGKTLEDVLTSRRLKSAQLERVADFRKLLYVKRR